jgi:hypothetical protein
MHYSRTMSELEPAIRQLFDATNQGDSEAFLDAFAADGRVARMVITG